MTKGLRLVLSVAYILLLLILSYNLPFSAFFRSFHSYDELFSVVERSNQLRTRKGKDYFSYQDPVTSTKFYKRKRQHSNFLIAIGIISIGRSYETKSHESYGYLYQSASSIDKLLKNDKVFMNSSFAFICNVDLYPSKHTDAQHLSHFMPYVERYGNNSIGLNHDFKLPNSDASYRSIVEHKTVYEKETYDYVFCLNAAAHLKPKYILLIEDDSVPHKDFPHFLSHLLDFHFQESSDHYLLSFIKFYYPSKWQGFSVRTTEIVDLISFSILGTTIYCLILYLYFLRNRQRFEDCAYYKQIICGFLISLISCHIIGRQNLNELRRILPQFYRVQSSEMCCTQAMLYPINVVESLSKFMVTQASTGRTDLLIWDFADLEKLPSYQIEPNLFHHTGIHSSLSGRQKHPEEFIFSS